MNNIRPASTPFLHVLVGYICAAGLGLAPGLVAVGHAQVAVEQAGLAASAKAPAATGGAGAKAAARPKAAAGQRQDAKAADAPTTVPNAPMCVGEISAPVAISVVSGKSMLFKLPAPIVLRTLGDDDVVQARMIAPQMLYILGVGVGSTNMILQDLSGVCTVVDVAVGMDTGALQAKLAQLMPDEKGIKVSSAADTLVLSGVVASDAVKVDHAVTLANAYVRGALDGGRLAGRSGSAGGQGGAGGQVAAGRQSVRVVNLLSVAAPQQVLLEVKVAEVAKTLVDKLGVSLNLNKVNGDWTYAILADLLSGGAAA